MNVAATYNILSLCAGVGGLDLGIRIAVPGARSVCLVEREAYAAAVLGARMEEGWLHPAPIWLGDIGAFDPAPWRGRVHCIASGDPCQPNSVAGKRQGADDDRWLIDQVLRIVDGVRPDRVFRENVVGNADGQLAALVPPLEAMGYRVAAGIFSAAEVGARHRRERLFIMADRQGGHGRLQLQPGRSGQAGVEFAGGGQAMGDAQSDFRRRELETSGAWGGGSRPSGAGGPMGNTLRPRSLSAAQRGVHSGQEGSRSRHEELGGRGVGLADACGAGLEGREQRGPSGERHGAEAS